MSTVWPAMPYDAWSATCDTLHAHTQILGKLAAKLAPREPQLQHAALRLTQRGWETLPLPSPDGSGAFGVVLDLRTHQAVIEHNDGRRREVPLTPNRAVGQVTRDVLDAVRQLAGAVAIDPKPQETPWTTPLDEDDEHATYDAGQVSNYFAAATEANLVLAALRAPYRGRSTPVNVAARAAWHDEEITASYRQHRPMAERSISWLVAQGNRRLRYRGIERNDAWLQVRVAALNLRRLLALGLSFEGGWKVAST